MYFVKKLNEKMEENSELKRKIKELEEKLAAFEIKE